MGKARQELANQWTGETCTLDGEPARVTGRLNRFATVKTIDPSGPIVEFSWEAVDRMMQVGGYFHSGWPKSDKLREVNHGADR